MKIGVSGLTGFVGSALSKVLLLHGISISKLSRCTLSDTQSLDDSIGLDIDWTQAVAGCDVVVHLAARAHIMHERAANPLTAFREANVYGTLRLAAMAATSGVRRFVFISSVKVNGEATLSDHPFTELDLPNPQDPYAISKWEAEQGLRRISDRSGMELVVIRPPLVYGPFVKANFSALMGAVKSGLPLPLASVRNKRSFVALDNLVDFIVVCATHPAAANQTFLVSDGKDMSTPDLIRAIARAADVPTRLLPLPVGVLEVLARLIGREAAVERLCGNLQVDVTKAREVIGWTPPVDVDEALRRCFIRPIL